MDQAIFNYYVLNDYMPWTACKNNSNQYTGYEYDLLKHGLDEFGLKEQRDYRFSCISFDNSLSLNENFHNFFNTRNHTGVIGGFTINPDRINLGYAFSIPTNQDNLLALSYTNSENQFILNSYVDFSVTLSYFLSLILVGVLFFLYEKNVNSDYAQNFFTSIFQGFWQSYVIMYRLGDKIRSFPSKCLQISLMFTSRFIIMLLICSIVLSYKKEEFTQLKPPSQMQLTSAFTFKIYYDIVLSYGIKIENGGYNDTSPIDDILQGLKDGKYDSVIIDASVLTSIASNQCEFQIRSLDFYQFNMGVMMADSPENKEFMRITNKALALAKDNATFLKQKSQEYFTIGNTCGVERRAFLDNGENVSDPIDYKTFLEIFIVFIIILIIAIVAKLFERKMRMFFKNKKKANKFIKKVTGADSQILKKITIFFELLMKKWNKMMRMFEIQQAQLMENEKNCTYLVHQINNKVYSLVKNRANTFEKNFNSELKSQSINKSEILPKKSKFLSSFIKKHESNFATLEDLDMKFEEKDENERLKKE